MDRPTRVRAGLALILASGPLLSGCAHRREVVYPGHLIPPRSARAGRVIQVRAPSVGVPVQDTARRPGTEDFD
jgi:hypothetical protein